MANLDYRKGFTEGAKAVLDKIPVLLDRGLPLVDALAILQGWTQELEGWMTDIGAPDVPPDLNGRQ